MGKKIAQMLRFTNSGVERPPHCPRTRSMAAASRVEEKPASKILVIHGDDNNPNDEVQVTWPNGKSPSRPSSAEAKSLKDITTIYRNSRQQRKLDSNAFQVYLEYMWQDTPIEKKAPFIYFDCLWFNVYLNGSSQKAMSWMKDKGVFLKTYTIVPIVCWGHWSLLLLCNFGEGFNSLTRKPCMVLLDSLHSAGPNRLEKDIRRFVLDIYKIEGREEAEADIATIPLLIPQVPQQRNGEECGIFVLFFIHLFMQTAPEYFHCEGYPYFLTEDWFTGSEVDQFEKHIRSFLAGTHDPSGLLEMEVEREENAATESKMEMEREAMSDEEEVKREAPDAVATTVEPRRQRSVKRRSYTSCCDVHCMETKRRICVKWNGIGQPVGPGGRSLRTFLGTLARNPDKLPIDYEDWRKVPQMRKDDMFDDVQRKYAVPDSAKKWVLKYLSDKWRSWKYVVRKRYFKTHEQANQQKFPKTSNVHEEQWKRAVLLWTSSQWQRSSATNKKNKSMQKWFHCAGTRSVANVHEEIVQIYSSRGIPERIGLQ